MTQSSALYNELSVRENLAFFGKLYGLRGARLRERIEETLRLVDLSERIDAPCSTLSGGMRQRVSLASALIHQPRLLFLDEPTVGIDPELRMTFWNYFETLTQQGVTLVVSTHHMDEAKRCHRLALMRFGKLLAVDSPRVQAQSGEDDFDRAFLYFARRPPAPAPAGGAVQLAAGRTAGAAVCPLSQRVARFNRRVTNRITRPFADRLPRFGIVIHIGRTSGRTYRTPVNVFRDGNDYIIALTYGAETDWVCSVQAAGGCQP